MSVRSNDRAWISRAAITFSAVLIATLLLMSGMARPAAAKGSTTLALDPGAASALTSLGVSVAPVSPASAGPNGVAFPITGFSGRIWPPALKIKHSGGLALSAGPTTVQLTDYTIVVDRSPDLVATVNGGPRVSILKLDFSKARLGFSGGLTLGPVKASLTAAAADALNGAFGVSAFTKGLVLGNATVRLGG
jgi:hypothetical protein